MYASIFTTHRGVYNFPLTPAPTPASDPKSLSLRGSRDPASAANFRDFLGIFGFNHN